MRTENTCESAMPPAIASAPARLIRLPDVLNKVGLGRTAWLELVKNKSAPLPVKIGRATLWVESEVFNFIQTRIDASRRGGK